MKTFLRKLKLSFLAMLCGWGACNIAWWLGAIPSMDAAALQHTNLRQTAAFATMVGIFTAIVIAMAWLIIFVPVDLCLKNDSKLRRPKAAALFGFLVAFSIVAAVLGYIAWFDGFWKTLDKAALPYILGTCATGAVAAYVRACLDKLQARATP